MKTTSHQILSFQKKIYTFYKDHKRDFPWRETFNPYHILVSEVMLQQTQTNRVVPKYLEFIKKFPTLSSLAKASNEDVLRLWSGLGYNRRALYLKQTTETIKKDYKGILPLDPKTLQTFPGIGPNTAASIFVFSKNEPYTFIETNIRRVYIHEFFKEKDSIHDDDLLKYIEATLDRKSPREWYYALMDYGSYLKTKTVNPNRKSATYAKQAKFKGSIREARGEILKVILKDHSVSLQILKEKVKSIHFETALQQLKKEKFLRVQDNKVEII